MKLDITASGERGEERRELGRWERPRQVGV